MWRQLTSSKRARALSLALFLLGLALISFLGAWWPGIVLVIGLPLAFKQFLVGRAHDMILTLIVFGGVFITYQYEIDWQMLLPVLFLVAAVYVIFREYTDRSNPTTIEEEEDINIEIEEEEEDK